MVDLTRLTSSISTATPGGQRASAPTKAPKGYSFAEEVQRRANVSGDEDSPQNQASLQRLRRVLDSGQPLRGDVPRGFYLDLRV